MCKTHGSQAALLVLGKIVTCKILLNFKISHAYFTENRLKNCPDVYFYLIFFYECLQIILINREIK